MHIELDTENLSKADGLALIMLIHSRFPNLMETSAVAINAVVGAESLRARNAVPTDGADADLEAHAAFAPGAVPGVLPSAAEAFSSPPASEAAPAAPSAPGATTPAPAQNSSAISSPGNVDFDGLPWDARIHSSNNKKSGDGRWMKRRGVSNDTVTKVQAELKAALAANPFPTAATAPLAPTPAPQPPVTASAPPVAPAPATLASAPPASPPLPVATGGHTGGPPFPPEVAQAAMAAMIPAPFQEGQAPAVVFTGVMQRMAELQGQGVFTQADVATVCAAVGITQARDIIQRPDVAPAFVETMNAIAASRAPA